MPTVQVNDITMYYEVRGAGPPLVLVPGSSTDVSEYEGIIGPLAERFTVVALDNRGAGRTDKPDAPYSIEMMADDTAGLLRAIGIGPATVLGISMGGRISLALALGHPDLVGRLVLVSTSAGNLPRRRWMPLLNLVPRLPIFRSRYPQPRYAFERQRRASLAFNCAGRLHEIHVPATIMHGRRDRVVPYRLAEALHAGIAGSRLISFEGGHLFFFFRQRARFLDAVVAAAGG